MSRASLLSCASSALLRYLHTTLLRERGDTDWWKQYVVGSLSVAQAAQVKARNLTQLSQLDLAALLRVFQRNISELTFWTKLPPDAMTLSHLVAGMRNAQAHTPSGDVNVGAEDAWREADTALRFLRAIGATEAEVGLAHQAREDATDRMLQERKQTASLAVKATTHIAEQEEREAPAPNEALSSWPQACRVGPLTVFGPGPLSAGEVQTFEDKSAPGTTIPWSVHGLGAELTIDIALLDDPEPDRESGQVKCSSRNSSPQKWDEVVERLRIGIRSLPSGELCMDLRTAVAHDGKRATRCVVPLAALSQSIGLDAVAILKSLGAVAVGTRESTIGDTSRNRGWPCVVFPRDNLLPAIAGWILTTAMAFEKHSSVFESRR